MTKTKSQKLRAKAAKAGSKRPAQQKSSGGAKRAPNKNRRKNKKSNRRMKGNAPRSKGAARAQSSVSDGLNTGMVWKNTNSVSDFFKPRFEKVADLVTVGNANNIIAQFYLNPGNTVLFPVFGQIAATYEEYVCHLLRFWYRGEEYTASGSNVTAGILAYATNMDPDDSNFSNVSQMENYEGCVSGPPFSGHFCHDVEVAHRNRGRNRSKGDALALNQYFVYSSGNQEAPSGQPGKFYDMGNFQIMENKCQASSPAGELWVEHSWTMIRRKQQTPINQAALQAHITELPKASATGAHPLGTTGGSLAVGSTIPITFSDTQHFTIPIVGNFLQVSSWMGANIAAIPSFVPGSNISYSQNIFQDDTGGNNSGFQSSASWDIRVATVIGAGTTSANYVGIGGNTSMTAATCDIFLVGISTGLMLKELIPRLADNSRIEVLENRFAALMAQLQGGISPTTLRDYTDYACVGLEYKYKDGLKSTAIDDESETVSELKEVKRHVHFPQKELGSSSSSSSSTTSGVTSWLRGSK